MVQLVWKTVWQFFRKVKIELYDIVSSLLNIYSKDLKTGILKKRLYTCIQRIIIHVDQKVEATQISVDRLMDK